MGELARKRLRGQGRFQTIKIQRYAFSLSESAYRCVFIIFVLLSLLQRKMILMAKKPFCVSVVRVPLYFCTMRRSTFSS